MNHECEGDCGDKDNEIGFNDVDGDRANNFEFDLPDDSICLDENDD